MDKSKTNVSNHSKIFLMIGLAFLLISLFVSLIFNMVGATQAKQAGQEVFHQDALPASSQRKQGYDKNYLVPVGITTGVRFSTEGIVVLGAGDVVLADGTVTSPSRDKLLPGDIVTKVSGKQVQDINEMTKAIHAAGGTVVLGILRDDVPLNVELTPVRCGEEGLSKIGCWVRDSTQGIGTITYYCPHTWRFGALGHGIMDVDTGRLLSVREGQLLECSIIDVRHGKKGAPGELIGEIKPDLAVGEITKNCHLGIYGNINRSHQSLPTIPFPTACHLSTTRGPAKILSNIEGGPIRAYDIFIENINQDQTSEKGMVIRITDPTLIKRTGGIVQGMSGSPIIQSDHLVGAITHVFVQNPLRGYGVFIDRMSAE
ncbi:MAG: SpoIVB peptidase [Defluviitaleaceae bacterium]|nr:SpoIVB peptidase [Defluviitaleaceae bacterium]